MIIPEENIVHGTLLMEHTMSARESPERERGDKNWGNEGEKRQNMLNKQIKGISAY